jgi:hypothetical protein
MVDHIEYWIPPSYIDITTRVRVELKCKHGIIMPLSLFMLAPIYTGPLTRASSNPVQQTIALRRLGESESFEATKKKNCSIDMSGVWVFRDGVVRLVENPTPAGKRRALLHTPTGEVVSSHASLEHKLAALGWERYYSASGGGDGTMLQYHKRSSVDLISLPTDFAHFSSVHMYDIVVKNREAFRVIQA